jgi:hypothetical protein
MRHRRPQIRSPQVHADASVATSALVAGDECGGRGHGGGLLAPSVTVTVTVTVTGGSLASTTHGAATVSAPRGSVGSGPLPTRR